MDSRFILKNKNWKDGERDQVVGGLPLGGGGEGSNDRRKSRGAPGLQTGLAMQIKDDGRRADGTGSLVYAFMRQTRSTTNRRACGPMLSQGRIE